MQYGYHPDPDVLSLDQLVRSFNLQHVSGGYAFFNKLETTAENQKNDVPVFKYDGLEFARLFAAKKLESLPVLTRRANSKALSEKLSFALMTHTQSKLANAYARTFLCANYVVSEQGRFKSKYCHNRWCLTCGRIKTAHYISEYQPIIQGFREKYFVTLTHRNPDAGNLKPCLAQMGRDWRKITDLARKQKRGFRGIKKLECTYNGAENTYHPHFHVLTDSKENADWLLNRWIELDPFNRNNIAQDVRPATDGSIKELFKYFTKLTTNSSKDPNITIPAINHIFETIKGKRVFQSFGFVKKTALIAEIGLAEYDQRNREQMEILVATKKFLDTMAYEPGTAYNWDPRVANWINYGDGDYLTEYKPTENVLTFEQKFRYETGTTINRDWSNNRRNKGTNRGLFAVRPGLVARDAGPPQDLEQIEVEHDVQKRPPRG